MPASGAPTWRARVGAVVVAPRTALAATGEPRLAGQAGSDLLRLIALCLVTVHLRRLVAAGWLAVAVDLGVGLRGLTSALAQALTVTLAAVVAGAFVVFALAGSRRALGRAFDLACVAAVPLVLIEIVGAGPLRVVDSPTLALALRAIGFAWAGALGVLAVVEARRGSTAAVALPPASRPMGWAVLAIAAAVAVAEVVWIAQHRELLRPLRAGDQAPALALPQIEAGGALGAVRRLEDARGNVVVVDFWATWCGPCLRSLPSLDRLATERAAAGVEVWAVNVDDASAARALFDRAGYRLPLLADDGDTSARFGVNALPHTVVVDRRGRVVEVHRGNDPAGIRAAVDAAQ